MEKWTFCRRCFVLLKKAMFIDFPASHVRKQFTGVQQDITATVGCPVARGQIQPYVKHMHPFFMSCHKILGRVSGVCFGVCFSRVELPSLTWSWARKKIQTHIRARVFYLHRKYTLCNFHQAQPGSMFIHTFLRIYNYMYIACCWRHNNGLPLLKIWLFYLICIPFWARFVVYTPQQLEEMRCFGPPFLTCKRIFSLKGCKSAQMRTFRLRIPR